MEELEKKVLYVLCCHCLDVYCGYLPLPSTLIAKDLDISLYKARKTLTALKGYGYIESFCSCEKDEEGNHVLRGYRITAKAKNTEEYKQAEEVMQMAV